MNTVKLNSKYLTRDGAWMLWFTQKAPIEKKAK